MKFGDIPIDEAEGAVLAHSARLDGVRVAKGRVLDGDDIGRLREAGARTIVGAHLEPDDVPEDTAAARIGQALAGDSVEVADAATGRVNVFARFDGLCVIDVDAINAMNATDESMTIATLAQLERVRVGQMIASVKIIPFAVPEARLATVLRIVAGHPRPIRVQRFRSRTVGVVFSELPTVPFKGKDKAVRVLAQRLEALGGAIDAMTECRHESEAVARAIEAHLSRHCDLLLLFGASAIVDRGDVIPGGIVRAGGEVTYFGMPVEPGNMLLLGRVGDVDAIGLPGCARSPKFNGFDWVLQRLFAGLPVTGREIAAMGVGGLLKDVRQPARAGTRARS